LPQHIKRTGKFSRTPFSAFELSAIEAVRQCRHPEFPLDSRDGGFRPRCGVSWPGSPSSDHEGQEPHDRQAVITPSAATSGRRGSAPDCHLLGEGCGDDPARSNFRIKREAYGGWMSAWSPPPLAGRLRRAEHPAGAFSRRVIPNRRSCGRCSDPMTGRPSPGAGRARGLAGGAFRRGGHSQPAQGLRYLVRSAGIAGGTRAPRPSSWPCSASSGGMRRACPFPCFRRPM
jgi:hypothetical protein